MTSIVRPNLEDNVVVLAVSYEPGEFLNAQAQTTFRFALVEKYNEIVSANPDVRDCIVVIEAEAAASALVRGLFELWTKVRSRGGCVVCAHYPADYIDSLLSLGLPDMPGFLLAANKDDAFSSLAR